MPPRDEANWPYILISATEPSAVRIAGRPVPLPERTFCIVPVETPVHIDTLRSPPAVVRVAAVVASGYERDLASVSGVPFRAGDGAGILLATFLERMNGATTLSDWAETCVREMLGALLGERFSRQRATHDDPTRDLAEEFILRDLSRLDLSPQVVASAVNVSVRTLHRVFAQRGETVGGWIRDRRLQSCRDAFLDERNTGLSIAEIAALRGFVDPAHFSRTFRKAFNATPREVRTGVGSLLFA